MPRPAPTEVYLRCATGALYVYRVAGGVEICPPKGTHDVTLDEATARELAETILNMVNDR